MIYMKGKRCQPFKVQTQSESRILRVAKETKYVLPFQIFYVILPGTVGEGGGGEHEKLWRLWRDLVRSGQWPVLSVQSGQLHVEEPTCVLLRLDPCQTNPRILLLGC